MKIIDFSNMNELISLLSALLTPTIAVLGAYIAWCQWVTNEQKKKTRFVSNEDGASAYSFAKLGKNSLRPKILSYRL